MFTVSSDGGLWHLWELERGSDWSSWEYVGRPKSGPIASHPAIINDDKGWWAAYAVSRKFRHTEYLYIHRSTRVDPGGMDWVASHSSWSLKILRSKI